MNPTKDNERYVLTPKDAKFILKWEMRNRRMNKTIDRIADVVEQGIWCLFLLLCTLQFVPWYQWLF